MNVCEAGIFMLSLMGLNMISYSISRLLCHERSKNTLHCTQNENDNEELYTKK